MKIAQNALTTTFAKFEAEEYDPADGLFRGGAVYADGIAVGEALLYAENTVPIAEKEKSFWKKFFSFLRERKREL